MRSVCNYCLHHCDHHLYIGTILTFLKWRTYVHFKRIIMFDRRTFRPDVFLFLSWSVFCLRATYIKKVHRPINLPEFAPCTMRNFVRFFLYLWRIPQMYIYILGLLFYLPCPSVVSLVTFHISFQSAHTLPIWCRVNSFLALSIGNLIRYLKVAYSDCIAISYKIPFVCRQTLIIIIRRIQQNAMLQSWS